MAAVMSLAVAKDNDVEAVAASVDIDYWDHWGMDEVVVGMDNFPCDVEAIRTQVLVVVVEEVIAPDSQVSLTFQY